MAITNENTTIHFDTSIEGGDIDRDRIVDGDILPDEYFCPICRYLLWNPRSCSSCQHLFCQKCIQTWLKHSNASTQCPFRCPAYKERNCPPSFSSLLSKTKIKCRNTSLGCTEVLSYDLLERHENVECKFLTRTCHECMQSILVSEFDEHIKIPGKCSPCPIRCIICQLFIEKHEFQDHFFRCYHNRLANVFQEYNRQQQGLTEPQAMLALNAEQRNLYFCRTLLTAVNLVEQQGQNSRFPTTLRGIDTIKQARIRGCGHLHHIYLMMIFILMNWRRAPQLIWIMTLSSLVAASLMILGLYVICLEWASKHIYLGIGFIMLFSSFISFGIPYFLQCVTDKCIIFSTGSILLLIGCTTRAPLEVYEMDLYANNTTTNIVRCCLEILVAELFLLLFRFVFWCSPMYLTAAILTFVNIYFTIRIRRTTAMTTIINLV
ncbi:unnamed protein product [Rotaria magnacalcarata]|uniref:RING-type domain-containing protein n=1 Tax=Rotaria magnacalcarata TaxID=392030 RepID=A0A816QZG2_9BILA|nr:unnamed protein product [Rotaria magnacalcarata]CAF3829055.1 unnamed protein product [Rotaria magnacalcarata]